MSRCLALCFTLMTLLGAACDAPAAPAELDAPPVADAAAAPGEVAPLEAAELEKALRELDPVTSAAMEVLRHATDFESVHVGIGGWLSTNVVAFRVILSHRRAAELFPELYATATPAGKLYALCGLYFTDPAAFAREVPRMAADRSPVTTFNGCIRNSGDVVGDVVRAPFPGRMQIGKGQTLAAWFAAHGSAPGDIAGGYVPLSFVEDQRAATIDGL